MTVRELLKELLDWADLDAEVIISIDEIYPEFRKLTAATPDATTVVLS